MTAHSSVFLWLKKITKEDADIVGNKAAKLGDLLNAGFPLVDGFIVTATAYFHFLHENRLHSKIKHLLTTINYEQSDSILQVSLHIKKLLREASFSNDFIKETVNMYATMSGSLGSVPITISLSGHPEQETGETILLQGEANLLQKIKEMWADLFSPQALLVYHRKKQDPQRVGISLIVQKAFFPETTGVILTINPLTNDPTKLILETHNQAFLSAERTNELLTLGKNLQQHLYFPHEISWGIEKGKIHIQKIKHIPYTHVVSKESPLPSKLQLLLTGVPASTGIVTGQVKLIYHPRDLTRVHHGDIIVSVETNPSFRAALKKAGGLITEKGVRTSPSALLARELGKPAVVGVEDVMSFLKNGTFVTIKGSAGEIYKAHGQPKVFHTATRVLGDFSEKFSLEDNIHEDFDGIGRTTNLYINNSPDELFQLCKAIHPHPVIYGLSHVSDESFKKELEMVTMTRKEKKCTNLWVLLPTVATLAELAHIKHFMASVGLSRSPTFKLFLTVSFPGAAIMLEDFIKAGIDGVVINIDELTEHVLPTNADPLDPSILWILEKIIKTAHKHKITSSMYGQALTDHPALIEKVVRLGITSVTVTPTHLEHTRSHVAEVEKKIINKL